MSRQQPQKRPTESAYVSTIPRLASPSRANASTTRISTSRKHRTSSHQSSSPIKYSTLIALITVFGTLLLQQTFVALNNIYTSVDMRFSHAPEKPVPDYDPPPYTPTDPSVSARESEATFPNSEEEKTRLRKEEQGLNDRVASLHVEMGVGASSSSVQNIPKSNAIKSSTSVALTGQLEVLGPISSSSSVTLMSGVTVNGDISSSASVKLSTDIKVNGKIKASGSIILKDSVQVYGKVKASGQLELRDGVGIEGNVECSGSATMGDGVVIVGEVKSSGSLTMLASVTIQEDVKSSGKITISGPTVGADNVHVGANLMGSTGCLVDGVAYIQKDMKISGTLTVNGKLHVVGDLTVNGKVSVSPGAELKVDGKRTINGSVQGIIGTFHS